MLSNILALMNHPVTRAIIDVGQYAIRTHIMPAIAENKTPETKVEEYAYEEPNNGVEGDDGEGKGRTSGA